MLEETLGNTRSTDILPWGKDTLASFPSLVLNPWKKTQFGKLLS